MYKDLISYELAEGVSEEKLREVATDIVNNWMKKLPGFISWEINKTADNKYTDIVCWEDQASAKNAETEMMNIPNAAEWYGCYKQGTISSIGLYSVEKY